jgi:hypothetical protein
MMGRLKRFSDKAVDVASDAGDSAKEGMSKFYSVAMNHPKTSAAVVLGAGAAAALVWLVQRNGGFNAVRKQVLARVRRSPTVKRIARSTERAA